MNEISYVIGLYDGYLLNINYPPYGNRKVLLQVKDRKQARTFKTKRELAEFIKTHEEFLRCEEPCGLWIESISNGELVPESSFGILWHELDNNKDGF